jgi:hypothetical protein
MENEAIPTLREKKRRTEQVVSDNSSKKKKEVKSLVPWWRLTEPTSNQPFTCALQRVLRTPRRRVEHVSPIVNYFPKNRCSASESSFKNNAKPIFAETLNKVSPLKCALPGNSAHTDSGDPNSQFELHAIFSPPQQHLNVNPFDLGHREAILRKGFQALVAALLGDNMALISPRARAKLHILKPIVGNRHVEGKLLWKNKNNMLVKYPDSGKSDITPTSSERAVVIEGTLGSGSFGVVYAISAAEKKLNGNSLQPPSLAMKAEIINKPEQKKGGNLAWEAYIVEQVMTRVKEASPKKKCPAGLASLPYFTMLTAFKVKPVNQTLLFVFFLIFVL